MDVRDSPKSCVPFAKGIGAAASQIDGQRSKGDLRICVVEPQRSKGDLRICVVVTQPPVGGKALSKGDLRICVLAIYVASSVHRQSMWPRACIGDLCGLPRIWSGNSNVSCGPGDPPRHAEINDPRSNKVGIVMVRSCQGGEGGRGGFPSPSLLLRLLLSLNKIKHSSRLPSVWC